MRVCMGGLHKVTSTHLVVAVHPERVDGAEVAAAAIERNKVHDHEGQNAQCDKNQHEANHKAVIIRCSWGP